MGEANRKEQTKAEAFAEKPEMFLDLRDVVIAVTLKADHGDKEKMKPGVLINPSANRMLVVNALYDLTEEIKRYTNAMAAGAQMKDKSHIIKPGDNGGVNRIEGTGWQPHLKAVAQLNLKARNLAEGIK